MQKLSISMVLLVFIVIFFSAPILAYSFFNVKITSNGQSPLNNYISLSSLIKSERNFKSVKITWDLPSGILLKSGSLIQYWTSVTKGSSLLNSIEILPNNPGVYHVSVAAVAYTNSGSNYVNSDQETLVVNKNLYLEPITTLFNIEVWVLNIFKVVLLLIYLFIVYKIFVFLYKEFQKYINS